MLSKNNFKERLRKMEPRKERFSIRKFSVGAASVLIGFFYLGMNGGQTVNADEVKANAEPVVGQELNADSNRDSAAASEDQKITSTESEVKSSEIQTPIIKDDNSSVKAVEDTKASQTLQADDSKNNTVKFEDKTSQASTPKADKQAAQEAQASTSKVDKQTSQASQASTPKLDKQTNQVSTPNVDESKVTDNFRNTKVATSGATKSELSSTDQAAIDAYKTASAKLDADSNRIHGAALDAENAKVSKMYDQLSQTAKDAVKAAAIETEKKNLAAPTISSVQEKYAEIEAKLQNGELTGEAAQNAANALKAEIEKLSAADQAKLAMMVSTVKGLNDDNADLSGIKVPKSEWPKYASKYDTLNMQTDVLDKNSSSKSLAFKIVSRIWGGNIDDQGKMQLRIQLDDRLVPYVSGIKVSTQGDTDHPSIFVSQKSMEKVADSDNTWSIKLIKLHGGIMGQANVDIPYTNPKCEIEFNSSIKDFFGNLKDIKENPLKYAIYGINGEDNPTVIGNYQSTGYIFSTDNAPYGTIPVATGEYANKPARIEKTPYYQGAAMTVQYDANTQTVNAIYNPQMLASGATGWTWDKAYGQKRINELHYQVDPRLVPYIKSVSLTNVTPGTQTKLFNSDGSVCTTNKTESTSIVSLDKTTGNGVAAVSNDKNDHGTVYGPSISGNVKQNHYVILSYKLSQPMNEIVNKLGLNSKTNNRMLFGAYFTAQNDAMAPHTLATAAVDIKNIDQSTAYQPDYSTITVEQGKSNTSKVSWEDNEKPDSPNFAITTEDKDFDTSFDDNGNLKVTAKSNAKTGVHNIPVTVTYTDNTTDNVNVPVIVTDPNNQTAISNENGVVIVTSQPITTHKTSKDNKIDSTVAKNAIKSVEVYTFDKDGKLVKDDAASTNDSVKDTSLNGVTTVVAGVKTATEDKDKAATAIVSFKDGSEAAKIAGDKNASVPVKVTLNGASAVSGKTAIHNNPDSLPAPSDLVNTTDLTKANNSEIATKDGKPDIEWANGAPSVEKTGSVSSTVRIHFTDNSYLDVPVSIEVKNSNTDDNNPTGKETTIKQGDPTPVAKNSIDPNSITNVPDGTTYAWVDGKKPDLSKPGKQAVQITVTYPDKTTDTVDTTVTVNETPKVTPIRVNEGTKNPSATPSINNIKDNTPGYPTSVTWKDGNGPKTNTPGVQNIPVTVHYPSGDDETVDVPVVVTEAPKVKTITPDDKGTLDPAAGITNINKPGENNPGLPSTVTWKTPNNVPTKPGVYNPTVVVTYPSVDGETTPTKVETTIPVVISDKDQTVISADNGAVIVTTKPVVTHKTSDNNVAPDGNAVIDKVETYKIGEDGKISTTPTSSNKTGVTAKWDETVTTKSENPSTVAKTNHNVTVTFGSDSDAVKDGIAKSGDTTEAPTPVTMEGAKATTGSVDVKGESSIGKLTSDDLGKLVDHSDLDNLPDGQKVKGYSWKKQPTVTNGKVGDDGVVEISFQDGSHLDIPVKGSQFNYSTESSIYTPSYPDSSIKRTKKGSVTPSWADDKKPTDKVSYKIDGSQDQIPKWIKSIDSETGKLTYWPTDVTPTGTYVVPVTVTYSDGSTKKISAHITVFDDQHPMHYAKGSTLEGVANNIELHNTTNGSMNLDDPNSFGLEGFNTYDEDPNKDFFHQLTKVDHFVRTVAADGTVTYVVDKGKNPGLTLHGVKVTWNENKKPTTDVTDKTGSRDATDQTSGEFNGYPEYSFSIDMSHVTATMDGKPTELGLGTQNDHDLDDFRELPNAYIQVHYAGAVGKQDIPVNVGADVPTDKAALDQYMSSNDLEKDNFTKDKFDINHNKNGEYKYTKFNNWKVDSVEWAPEGKPGKDGKFDAEHLNGTVRYKFSDGTYLDVPVSFKTGEHITTYTKGYEDQTHKTVTRKIVYNVDGTNHAAIPEVDQNVNYVRDGYVQLNADGTEKKDSNGKTVVNWNAWTPEDASKTSFEFKTATPIDGYYTYVQYGDDASTKTQSNEIKAANVTKDKDGNPEDGQIVYVSYANKSNDVTPTDPGVDPTKKDQPQDASVTVTVPGQAPVVIPTKVTYTTPTSTPVPEPTPTPEGEITIIYKDKDGKEIGRTTIPVAQGGTTDPSEAIKNNVPNGYKIKDGYKIPTTAKDGDGIDIPVDPVNNDTNTISDTETTQDNTNTDSSRNNGQHSKKSKTVNSNKANTGHTKKHVANSVGIHSAGVNGSGKNGVQTVGSHSQDRSSDFKHNNGTNANINTLPQTGEKQNNAGIFGLALASIAGFLGLAADRKRRKDK